MRIKLLLTALVLFFVALGSSGRAQIYQGSFVGNGTARTISIPTVTPTFVMVKNGATALPGTQQYAVVRVAGMTDSSAVANAATYADGITGLTSGGFTLGADAAVNESGTPIYWMAIKDVAGEIKTGSYVGNATDNRAITGLGFQPDLVWVIARANFDGGTSPAGSSFRTSTMSGDTTLPWTGGSAKADYVQAISSDGFEVGTNPMVNASGVTYYYLAMKNTAGLFTVGTYVGNATDNRQLTDFGFSPDTFFTKSATTTVSAVFKFTSMGASTDLSYLMNMGYPVADLIQKLLPDGVELGTATRVNTNTATFHWFGMKASPIPSASADAPTVTTPTSSSVTQDSATLGGNVTDDGGASITERGVVYALTATNANPEIGGTGVTKVAGTGTTGVFTVGATSLATNSAYSFKAYATNSEDTSYSSVGTFSTLADMTAPTVVSVVRSAPSAQAISTSSVTFRVTYSEPVTGVAVGRFVVMPVGGSDIVGTVTGVTPVSTSVYDVAVTITSGTGEFRLRVQD